MDLRSIIAALTGGASPDAAIMDAQGALPPQPAQQQAQMMPNIPATPQGARTPVTNPQSAAEAPKITQSPPDLANMYVQLMQKNQNAAALDSGMSLIAAGLSSRPDTRQALIQASASGGGGRGMSLSASDIINFDKQRQEQQNKLLRQSMLGGLMKQYKMSPEQIGYLESTGKLDEVLSHYSTENLAHVEDKETGKTLLFHPRTGKQVAELGGDKPDETIEVSDPNTGRKYLANKRTGEKIKDLVDATKPEGTSWQDTPSGRQLVSDVTGKPINTPLGNVDPNVGPTGTVHPKLDIGFDYKRDANGKVIETDGKPSVYAISGTKADQEQINAQQKKVDQKIEATAAIGSVANANKELQKTLDESSSLAPATGFGSKLVANTVGQLGGTASNIVRDHLDTIKANATFDKLAAMRQSSPTGGALGSISDFENRLLGASVAAATTNLPIPDLKKAVNRIQATMEVLADKSFKDKNSFKEALNKRMDELNAESTRGTSAGKVTVKRREPTP